MNWTERLGQIGVWRGVEDIDVALAQRIEELGYGTVWQGRSPRADLRAAEAILDATSRLVVATGIVNIWNADATELAHSYHRIAAKHPGRLVLGIGSGHREATPERVRPLAAMSRYLDILDEHGVPAHDRVLSALGPKMLQLAAERSGGTHPYLTVPAQTRVMREALGPGPLVAPEQTIVLDADPVSARNTARAFLKRYLKMSNYTTSMHRAGFTDDDVTDGGSDALVDAIVVHGTADVLASAVDAHLSVGADHVCVQVLPTTGDIVPVLRAVADHLPPLTTTDPR
jgi:probable F420-dependent oxidoreductase